MTPSTNGHLRFLAVPSNSGDTGDLMGVGEMFVSSEPVTRGA